MKENCPEGEADRESSAPVWRIFSVCLALVVAGCGLAPLGFAAIQSVAPFVELAAFPVWLLLIGLTFYAILTRKPERGAAAAFVLWMVAVLNLGGCVFVLNGIGRATGGS